MTTQHHGRHEPFVPMPRWEEKTIVRTDKLEDISALEVEIVINTTLSPRQWSFDASNAHCSTLTVVADKDDFFQSGWKSHGCKRKIVRRKSLLRPPFVIYYFDNIEMEKSNI